MINIEFSTKALSDYYFCHYSGKQPFSEIILERYRKVVTFMTQSENINMLSRFRGLNIEKYEDHWSARINDQFRVEFDFVKPNTIVILKISKHYE
jgi:Txe/YoeB family toxin of Txe-Axe toxin-antitoxin module